MNVNLDDYAIFRDSKDTLRNTSYDSASNEYMTDSEEEVVNFDIVKRKYCNGLSASEEMSDSVDALFEKDNRLIFIEFKNGNARNEKNKIRDKKDESVMIFCDITDKEIRHTRENAYFILVYNKEKTKISLNEEMAVRMAQISKLPYAIMDLDKHEGLCYKKIITMNECEFSKWLHDEEMQGKWLDTK